MIRFALTLVLLLAFSTAVPATAQDSSTLLSAAELGLPEMAIAITDDGWDAPSEVEAGRYLVTASYEGERDFGTAAFLRLPDDWTIDDLNARLAAGAAATASPSPDGTTVSSTVPALDWLYSLTLAGGVSPTNGRSAQGIVELEPGNWAIWADDYAPAAVPLTVTGEMPVALPEPEVAVTVTETHTDEAHRFIIEGAFAAGAQVVKVVNDSEQPHFMEVIQLSAMATPEQVNAYLGTPNATPDPAAELPEGFSVWLTPNYAAMQSSGTTQWIVVTLDPGVYALACWIPDPEQHNTPHALLGMLEVFEVEA